MLAMYGIGTIWFNRESGREVIIFLEPESQQRPSLPLVRETGF